MKVLYFGIYNRTFGRNRIYMKGLREVGVEVTECRDDSKGVLKYWRLYKKHRALGAYDALVVGYPGHLVVPFAKLISKRPVVADLLGSLADAEQNSHSPSWLRRLKSKLIDRMAVYSADVVLLESEAQRRFFVSRFGASEKYHVLYTGADESMFFRTKQPIQGSFVVLFRGRLTPESGILHILEAARLLEGEKEIRFLVIGFGQLLNQVKKVIARDVLTNVELITELLPEAELRERMSESSLSLGQFEDNSRLSRTIPHKAFESFAMGIPYLSGDAPAIRELVIEGETGCLSPLADPSALAGKIKALSGNPAILTRVGAAARSVYEERLSPRALATRLRSLIEGAIVSCL